MAVLQLRIPSGPSSHQVVSLDGVSIGLRLWWNARGQRWILDVEDAQGEAIASGLGLVTGVSLLARFGVRDDLPPGALIAVDTSGAGAPPGRDDLGGRVRVYYLDRAELLARAAAV